MISTFSTPGLWRELFERTEPGRGAWMRAAVFNAPGSVSVADRREPVIAEPTDAIVRVTLACVCGSDLWYYRGDSAFEPGPIGHEFVGVIEDVGADVTGLR